MKTLRIITLIILLLCFGHFYIQPNEREIVKKHGFEITRGHVIAMYHEQTDLVSSLGYYLGISNVTIFDAINGSHVKSSDVISLYTQYLMLSGRHDHMQLSSPAMLGCLLSHVEIWQSIKPNETIAVFEEDAYVDFVSAERMYYLSEDMRGVHWDIIILESGQKLIASGRWNHIGNYAANCSTIPCTWFGTRGYLLTYTGAQHLLRHVYPISVQVDALIALEATFNIEFKMFWTRENIAHQHIFHVSGIWDACLKCYMPTSPFYYLAFAFLSLFLLFKKLSYKTVH
jgi:GR25 family glycosyltransferase involved in LPS biosynthesis